MLFNSFIFLLAFLPASLALHALVVRYRPEWRLPLLLALSFVFYGYWDWRFLPLLASSILLNWLIAELFRRSHRGVLITAAIAANLAVLGLFKSAGFFADLLNLAPGLSLPRPELALPLGISFFTFHHIMYLTDLRAGRAPRYDLVRYGLYIAFFPQVLAGPLVRWSEIMHQLDERPYQRRDAEERFARGLMLLVVGLAKKVLLGDQLAEYTKPIFAAAEAGQALNMGEALQGTLGFTFQIYFDFSGYTDMALGLGLLFGIVLPQNFDVPYRATSLSDLWRRWHMTLSRFLRDYLYIPLGGNRHGLTVQLGALLATMTLGGLWHGAGWNFLLWGTLQGIGLSIIVLWRKAGLSMPNLLGWFLTFTFFALTLVIFRAETLAAAGNFYKALLGFGADGFTMSKWRALVVGAAIAMVGPTAWTFVHKLPPRRWIAALFAILFLIVLFKIGDDANYEFIYFQF
jgi:D-alanyl-lipoteichoic acid acyltransferase DltB (MBOAT superfamily)